MDNDLLEYYIQRADRRFDDIDKKLDSLVAFKWKIMGSVMAVSGIVSLGFQVLEAIARGK